MPEEGEENEKVRESESEKVAEPLPANKKRIEANKLSPEANTFSRGKVMVNLSHSKLNTGEKYRREMRAGLKNFTETNGS